MSEGAIGLEPSAGEAVQAILLRATLRLRGTPAEHVSAACLQENAAGPSSGCCSIGTLAAASFMILCSKRLLLFLGAGPREGSWCKPGGFGRTRSKDIQHKRKQRGSRVKGQVKGGSRRKSRGADEEENKREK